MYQQESFGSAFKRGFMRIPSCNPYDHCHQCYHFYFAGYYRQYPGGRAKPEPYHCKLSRVSIHRLDGFNPALAVCDLYVSARRRVSPSFQYALALVAWTLGRRSHRTAKFFSAVFWCRNRWCIFPYLVFFSLWNLSCYWCFRCCFRCDGRLCIYVSKGTDHAYFPSRRLKHAL
jgi:hypothetical protein